MMEEASCLLDKSLAFGGGRRAEEEVMVIWRERMVAVETIMVGRGRWG